MKDGRPINYHCFDFLSFSFATSIFLGYQLLYLEGGGDRADFRAQGNAIGRQWDPYWMLMEKKNWGKNEKTWEKTIGIRNTNP